MSSIVNLYVYMNASNELVKKLDKVSIDEFVKSEDMISAYLAIFKDLVKYLLSLEDMFNIADELTTLKKEIYEIDSFVMNSYKMVNANMLYDFFMLDYRRLFKIVSELVK